MGAAHYILLERAIDGLDTMIDGKSLSRNMESLDAAARQLGVRPLSEFFSMDPEELAEFMDGADGVELPPLQQKQSEKIGFDTSPRIGVCHSRRFVAPLSSSGGALFTQ